MKPGQTKLDRDYYKDATAECPEGQKVLSNYGRFQSIYDQNQNKNVHVGDYHVPAKSSNTMGKYHFNHLGRNVPSILILILISRFLYILVSYELVHQPRLYNSTKLGRDE